VLAVVCWLWPGNQHREFKPRYVNVLQRMIARHLSLPHKFYCITDETAGFSADVVVVPTPEKARWAASLKSAENDERFPSSYRRLWSFSSEATQLGDRIFNLDIDCVVTRSIDPLFANVADFVGWEPSSKWGHANRIGGGTWLLRTGTKTFVWDDFSPDAARRVRELGYRGSDQAWLSYCLKDEARWKGGHGIYQRQDMLVSGWRTLPNDARIVHFNGNQKPWQKLGIAWIKEHWR